MYHLVTSLVQPYTLLLLLMAAGLAMLWIKRKESRRKLLLVTVPFLLLVLISWPPVSGLALRTLENQYPPLVDRPPDAGAIVVLLAGFTPPDADHPEGQLDWDTLSRCVKAANLYHQGPPCPVLVTGGKYNPEDPGPSGAEVMRNFLVQMGVSSADLIVEPTAQTTYENATESHQLLQERGIHKVILVTEAIHMPRALATFRRQGIEAVPAPCNFELRSSSSSAQAGDYFPNIRSAFHFVRATHEWVGILWYKIHGRI